MLLSTFKSIYLHNSSTGDFKILSRHKVCLNVSVVMWISISFSFIYSTQMHKVDLHLRTDSNHPKATVGPLHQVSSNNNNAHLHKCHIPTPAPPPATPPLTLVNSMCHMNSSAVHCRWWSAPVTPATNWRTLWRLVRGRQGSSASPRRRVVGDRLLSRRWIWGNSREENCSSMRYEYIPNPSYNRTFFPGYHSCSNII